MPQHHVSPVAVCPQLKLSPSARRAKVSPPDTGARFTRVFWVPSPRAPSALYPQQIAAPEDYRPQVWPPPAARLAKRYPPPTAPGLYWSVGGEPQPSCDTLLSPQQ